MNEDTIIQIFAEKYDKINAVDLERIMNYQPINMPCTQVVLAGIFTINEIFNTKEDK